MKQLFNDPNLIAMAVPAIPARQHQLQLKRALLSSATHKPKGWKTFMTKKPLLIGGLTVGLAVVALTAVTFIEPQNSTASAQGLAKDSAKAVAKLSPADKQKLVTNFKANVDDQLKAAQSAKDLEVLTYDQVISKYGPMLPPKKPGTPDLTTLKYLKYTNAQGATVILGVDSHNLPVFCTVTMGDPKGAPGSGPATLRIENGAKSGPDSGPSFTTGGSAAPGTPANGTTPIITNQN